MDDPARKLTLAGASIQAFSGVTRVEAILPEVMPAAEPAIREPTSEAFCLPKRRLRLFISEGRAV